MKVTLTQTYSIAYAYIAFGDAVSRISNERNDIDRFLKTSVCFLAKVDITDLPLCLYKTIVRNVN